jgi:hypothetical protein
MKISRIVIVLLLLLTLTAYSKDFKWSSLSEAAEVNDTAETTENAIVIEKATETVSAAEPDKAVIIARADNTNLDTATPNIVSLPLTITFTSNQPVTLYYTTNGKAPTTSTNTFSTIRYANGTDTGPTISSYDNMLMVLGKDADGNLTPLLTYTFVVR